MKLGLKFTKKTANVNKDCNVVMMALTPAAKGGAAAMHAQAKSYANRKRNKKRRKQEDEEKEEDKRFKAVPQCRTRFFM